MATVSTPTLKIFSSWPTRDLGHKASLVDLYDHRPPIHIGELECKGFVKVNGSWVLHGVIHYKGGDALDSSILKTLSLVTLTIDVDRTDRSKGRKVIGIDRVLARPCEQTVNPREFVRRLR